MLNGSDNTLKADLENEKKNTQLKIAGLSFGAYPAGKAGIIIGTQPFYRVFQLMMQGMTFGDAFKNVKNGGIPSFFEGTAAGVTREIKKSLFKMFMIDQVQLWFKGGDAKKVLSKSENMQAGATLGFMESVLMSPTECYKTRKTAKINKDDPELAKKDKMNVAKYFKLLQEEAETEGRKGIQKWSAVVRKANQGLFITIVKQSGMLTSFFLSKEFIREQTAPYKKSHSKVVTILEALFPGLMTALVTLPLEVLKTNVQKKTKTQTVFKTWEAAQEIFAKSGWKGFLKGWQIKGPITLLSYAYTSFILDKITEIRIGAEKQGKEIEAKIKHLDEMEVESQFAVIKEEYANVNNENNGDIFLLDVAPRLYQIEKEYVNSCQKMGKENSVCEKEFESLCDDMKKLSLNNRS